jgi:hypothetical protein
VPLRTAGLDDVTSVSIGERHACANRSDGSVACWGSNGAGQCGHDTEYASAVRHLVVPVTVAGVTGAERVTVSAYTSCALGATGATCWGAILQTPEGLARAPDLTRPTRFEPLSEAHAMAIGNSCGCALLRDGSVGCFGVGPHGCPSVDPLLGLDPLFGGRPMQRLVVGDAGACAAREHGDWYCWRHPLEVAASDDGALGVSHYAPIGLQTVAFGAAEDVAFGHGPCALDGPSLRCLESNGSSDEPSLREHRFE